MLHDNIDPTVLYLVREILGIEFNSGEYRGACVLDGIQILSAFYHLCSLNRMRAEFRSHCTSNYTHELRGVPFPDVSPILIATLQCITRRGSKSFALTMRNARRSPDRYLRGHASNNRYRLAPECWAITSTGCSLQRSVHILLYISVYATYVYMRARCECEAASTSFLQSVLLLSLSIKVKRYAKSGTN